MVEVKVGEAVVMTVFLLQGPFRRIHSVVVMVTVVVAVSGGGGSGFGVLRDRLVDWY